MLDNTQPHAPPGERVDMPTLQIDDRESFGALLDALLSGRVVLMLCVEPAVGEDWITEERLEFHIRRTLFGHTNVEYWPIARQTWAVALNNADGLMDQEHTIHLHMLQKSLAESLNAEWQSAQADTSCLELVSTDFAPDPETDADDTPPEHTEEGDGAALAPIPAPAPVSAFKIVPVGRLTQSSGIDEHIEELNTLLEIMVNNQLKTQFQPIVNLNDGQVIAYEALIRLPKQGKLRRPGQMFHAADKARMVSWFDLACHKQCLARAEELGLRHLLFLNMEAEGLAYLDAQECSLAGYAFEHGISPSQIVIEITERQAVDDFPRLMQYIEKLREQGFKIAVDDAGAGYSSLHAIAELRPDFVKIDRTIIKNIESDGARRALLASLVQFTRQIGTSLLAEGAETWDELATIIDLGVPYAQGYQLAKPADDFRGIPKQTREFMRQRVLQRHLIGTGRYAAIGGLTQKGHAVAPETPLHDIVRRFYKDVSLSSTVVLTEEKPVGIILRDQLANVLEYADAAQARSMLPNESAENWMRTDLLIMAGDVSVLDASRRVTASAAISLDSDIVVVDGDGKYRGVLPIRSLMEAVAGAQENRLRYADPISGMPGCVVLEQMFDERIADKESLAVLRLDIHNFSFYNRVFGIACGDDLILALAHRLRDICERTESEYAFAAHLGGDNFVVLLSPARDAEAVIKALIAAYEEIKARFFTSEQLRIGLVDCEIRPGQRRQEAICALHIAGQTNLKRPLPHFNLLMDQVKTCLRYMRQQPTSHYYLDCVPERRQ